MGQCSACGRRPSGREGEILNLAELIRNCNLSMSISDAGLHGGIAEGAGASVAILLFQKPTVHSINNATYNNVSPTGFWCGELL